MPERWLPVIGSEDSYQVSDKGRVCSLDRVILYADGRRQPLKGRVLQPTISGRNKKTGNGYRAVSIGKRGKVKVCVLMAEAFIGPRPFMGARLRHLNDNSLDDRLENLAWGTDSDNKRDLVRNGRHNMTRKTRTVLPTTCTAPKTHSSAKVVVDAAYACGRRARTAKGNPMEEPNRRSAA